MHYYIITGASRGLGEAIARKLLGKNNQVYGLSRSVNDQLLSFAREHQYNLEYVACDLGSIIRSNDVLNGILDNIPWGSIQSITLINNAATIEPIRHIDDCALTEVVNSFNVNLLAPITFTSAFIRKYRTLRVCKKVINISSSGSKRSYDGLSCYISSKAGLSQFTKVVTEEQRREEFPAETLLIEPGSMDTAMQRMISSTPSQHCSWVPRFREIRRKGLLESVEAAADRVLNLVTGKKETDPDRKGSGFFVTTFMSLFECVDRMSPLCFAVTC